MTTITQKSHPAFQNWKSMKDRCLCLSHSKYPKYGGRGITICDRWLEPIVGFWNFVEDMGDKPSTKHTIDRIDNRKGYSPENCRWADQYQQNQNRTNNLKYQGVYLGDGCKNRYQARARINGKNVYVGSFASPEEASRARQKLMDTYFG